MRIGDHLSKEQKQQLNKMTRPKKKKSDTHSKAKGQSKPKPKKKENLSFRDIEELMGTRRDTYERRNGAVSRK